MSFNHSHNNLPSSNLGTSNYSVTPSELQSIYEEHWQMKQQIQLLKNTLNQCENKWNNIVNSLLKENVQLKASQEYYKNKYHQLVDKINQKKTRKSQPLIHTSHQLKTGSQPSTIQSKQSLNFQNKLNDTQISSVQNLWKNYLNCQQEPSFK